jgi:hypothetical protein
MRNRKMTGVTLCLLCVFIVPGVSLSGERREPGSVEEQLLAAYEMEWGLQVNRMRMEKLISIVESQISKGVTSKKQLHTEMLADRDKLKDEKSRGEYAPNDITRGYAKAQENWVKKYTAKVGKNHPDLVELEKELAVRTRKQRADFIKRAREMAADFRNPKPPTPRASPPTVEEHLVNSGMLRKAIGDDLAAWDKVRLDKMSLRELSGLTVYVVANPTFLRIPDVTFRGLSLVVIVPANIPLPESAIKDVKILSMQTGQVIGGD